MNLITSKEIDEEDYNDEDKQNLTEICNEEEDTEKIQLADMSEQSNHKVTEYTQNKGDETQVLKQESTGTGNIEKGKSKASKREMFKIEDEEFKLLKLLVSWNL